MSERQIEMLWQCSSCGQRNLGRHGACQACANPKDGSEAWFMPEGPAPTVTDPALLAMATAGASWRCAFCGSDQRATDGRCGQCGAAQQEGVPLDAAPPGSTQPGSTQGAPAPRPGGWNFPRVFWRPLIGGWIIVVTFLGLIPWVFPAHPHLAQEATVSSVRWVRSVDVARTHRAPREGFAEQRPAGALEVQSLGLRYHHDEQVPIGSHVEKYSETVPDGTRTETYTEREQCGETCTGSERSCRETCTSNQNGFATCKTTCSGGGRTCSTKYCTVTRTREVPRTRSVERTRTVTDYRAEKRDAEYFSWKVWEWGRDRTIEVSGSTDPPRWPEEAALLPPAPLGPGEEERASRRASYEVTFTTADGRAHPYPQLTEAEFLRLAPGSRHQVELTGAAVASVDAVRPSADLVPLWYRPQLWCPVVLLLMLPFLFAGRWWPYAPPWLAHHPRLRKLRPLRHLRHVLGLGVLFVAHVVASQPLEFVVPPSRALLVLGGALNDLFKPGRWGDAPGARTTWVVVSRPTWTGDCSGPPGPDGGVSFEPCSGEGLPPPLTPPARRSVRTGSVSVLELPSGRTLERVSPRLEVPGRFEWEESETRYSLGEEEYLRLLPAVGQLSSAVWEDHWSESTVTIRVGFGR